MNVKAISKENGYEEFVSMKYALSELEKNYNFINQEELKKHFLNVKRLQTPFFVFETTEDEGKSCWNCGEIYPYMQVFEGHCKGCIEMGFAPVDVTRAYKGIR